MTLTQSIALGQAGEEIDYLLNEIADAIQSPRDFDDNGHQREYIEDTITMIKHQLTNLKEK